MLLNFFINSFLLSASLLYSSAKDTITSTNLISDSKEDTIVSPEEKFELGFFTPNGSSDGRRYVGIWFYKLSPPTVVWVANRDDPLPDHTGVLSITGDGNLKLLDGKDEVYWGTNLEASLSSANTMAKLLDNGNLVVSKEDGESHSEKLLWQSFDNPTDTFLPGMKMDENLTLTSWRSYNDPATGNFTFELDQDEESQFIIWKRSMRYWKSIVSGKFIGSDEMPYAISFFLSNFTETITVHNASVPPLVSSLYSDTRLIMSYSGQAQYFKLDNEKIWAQVWAEPRDSCSVYNLCGNFGSCNSKNEVMCKCLPGFKPSLPDNWNRRDFSGGCSRESTICGKDAESHTFLNLSMVEVGSPDATFNARNETECKVECLNNCQCQAYSYQDAEFIQRSGSGGGAAACWIWSEDLNNLQEGYEGSRNISVRVAVSDIETTVRSCETCGTNVIPYPLSTGLTCGDTMYLNFICNISAGQVYFESPGGTYQVTSISQETRTLFVRTNLTDKCADKSSKDSILKLDQSSPFHATGRCSDDSVKGGVEVEIGWDPPAEPTCSSSTECKDWPNSTCNVTRNGKKKCLCNTYFQWDGSALNCTQGHQGKQRYGLSGGKLPLSLIIIVAFTTVGVLLVLSTTISYIYLHRRRVSKGLENRESIQRNLELHLYGNERQVKDMIDSGRFKQDSNTEGIDVPFFDFETIIAATSNFSNANKLGQGGFGPVYKGNFPGGQEIAVKRLSSGSGQGLEEFKNEVVLIAKLQHRNLVRLMGYFVSGEEKMLLYEYMPNKSLDSFIFDRKLCMLLNWETRYKIILGIARGLLYLHQDSRLRIIHRDLKASNILLDEEMNPKISDFGLARIFGGKETALNTNRVVGTYGYMSPEYALDGLFSFKSDVFSFGVVVIEMISGKRNTGFYEPEKSLSLLGYAWHLWKEGKSLSLMEPILGECCNANDVIKCVNVGLLCVQEDPNDRPSMSNIIFMLGSDDTATIPTPKQPAFVVRRCPSSKASSSSKPETFSHNGLTVTLEDGR